MKTYSDGKKKTYACKFYTEEHQYTGVPTYTVIHLNIDNLHN